MPIDVKRKFFANSNYTSVADLHTFEPWLLIGTWNGVVKIYNLKSDAVIHALRFNPVRVTAVKFIIRKNWYIVSTSDGYFKVFNCTTCELIVTVLAHPEVVACLAVHPTAPIILTGDLAGTIKAWNWERDWANTQTYHGHTDWIWSIAFNPKDSNTFAVAYQNGTVKMWSIAPLIADFTITAHDGPINSVDFYHGPDKPYFVTASSDLTVKVWDYLSQRCVQTMKSHTKEVSFAVFHPNLPIIISGSRDGTVKIWNGKTYELEYTHNYELEGVTCIALHKNTNEVAMGFVKGILTLELGHRRPVFSMDDSYRLLYMRDHCEVFFADLGALDNTTVTPSSDRVQVPLQIKILGSTGILPSSFVHSPDGRFVSVVGENKHIIYTVAGWHKGISETCTSFAWGPDSHTYAILKNSIDLRIYERYHGFVSLGEPGLVIQNLYTGPVLSARALGCVIFWDWGTKEVVKRIEIVHANNIYWSTTGTHVAVTTPDALYIFSFARGANQDKLVKRGPPPEDGGIPESFILLFTLQNTIQSATWSGDCLIYTTPTQLCYSIVSAKPPPEDQTELNSYTISPIDKQLDVVGYIPVHEKVYVVDKKMKVYGFGLSLAVIKFQMAVLRGDTDGARELYKKVLREEVNKVASRMKGLVMSTTSDSDYRVELARSLDDFTTAYNTALSLSPPTATPSWSHSVDHHEGDCYRRCIVSTINLMGTKATNKLISELSDDKAQDMVDFLSKMVNDENSLTQHDRKHALYLLSKLAKSAQVFPQSLELKGVQCDLTKLVVIGGYGYIYKGEHEGNTICVKAVVVDPRGIDTQKLRAHAGELIFWAHLSHPHVLPFLGIYPSDEHVSRVCIVSPWMDNGDLLEYLNTVSDVPRKPLVHDIISGLQYLHDLDIIHADLKAKNVLVSQTGRAMLADFGISRLSTTDTTVLTKPGTVGTANWMAPELLLEEEPCPNRTTDIWAFACTCYEIITGAKPFGQYDNVVSLIAAFIKGKYTPKKLTPGIGWDEDVWSLATQCWKGDPASRPSVQELLHTIDSFNFSDDRPLDPESRRRRNNVEVDYDRVMSILDEIHQSSAV